MQFKVRNASCWKPASPCVVIYFLEDFLHQANIASHLDPCGAETVNQIKSCGLYLWREGLSAKLSHISIYLHGLPWWLSGKESACQCRKHRFDPCVGKISWIRKWQPMPVFLPGKSHGQRSLMGCSPWRCKRVGHDRVPK